MSKVVDLNKWRENKNSDKSSFSQTPISGFLVWLHCPSCKTTEYTEVRMLEGRVHKCGTIVEEVEVQIDLRAEYTISQRNITILEQGVNQNPSESEGFLKKKLWSTTKKLLEQIKNNELEYQNRLKLMNMRSITPYPDEWNPKENGIEFNTVEPSGIMITVARQADKHFPQKK